MQRVSLLRFLCDEALGSTVIREQINAEHCVSKRNFLGRDSAGRLYWALGGPERLFVSGPHSEGEVSTASDSSSKEFDSWVCYESDAEIGSLVEWLRDNDTREKELKDTIINWQNEKLDSHNGEIDFHVNCFRTSVYGTNARAELAKKYGSFGEGRSVHEWKLYRCDCLELVGPTRHHCFSCHLTFFTNEVHQCKSSEKNLTLTDGMVLLNGNLHNTSAAFLVKQEVDSNKSPFDADWSNPKGITGKKHASFGSTENPSFVPTDQLHDSTAFFVKQGVDLNESPSKVAYHEDVTGKDPTSSSGPLMGRASEIIRCLKVILLDIETALPREAFRPSRVDSDKLQGWREYLKSAQSIHEVSFAFSILYFLP